MPWLTPCIVELPLNLSEGNFRVKGDTVDIYLAYNDFAYRVLFFGEEIEEIISFDPNTGETIEQQERVMIYPANLYVSPQRQTQRYH